jgi:hypothetical protein
MAPTDGHLDSIVAESGYRGRDRRDGLSCRGRRSGGRLGNCDRHRHFPIAGPVIAGGIMTAALIGALGGGTVGALAGAFAPFGISETAVKHYLHDLAEGRTVALVNAGNRYPDAAAGAIRRRYQVGRLPQPPLTPADHEINQASERRYPFKTTAGVQRHQTIPETTASWVARSSA